MLKNKTQAEVIKSFFTPPIGALIAAAISTFGIYLVASCLYVRDSPEDPCLIKLKGGPIA